MDALNPLSLVHRREALNLTRGMLAEEAAVAESTIWRIEEGKMGGNIETWRSLLATLDRLEQRS